MADHTVSENRRAQRVPFFSGGTLRRGSNGEEVTVVDISLNGVMLALIESERAWQVGDSAEVVVRLNDTGLEMVFSGVVRRIEPPLVGLEFVEMGIDTATHLRRLIELNTGKPAHAERRWDQLDAE